MFGEQQWSDAAVWWETFLIEKHRERSGWGRCRGKVCRAQRQMGWKTTAYGAIPSVLLLHTGLSEDNTGPPGSLRGETKTHGGLRVRSCGEDV